jgi:hypothetical protein
VRKRTLAEGVRCASADEELRRASGAAGFVRVDVAMEMRAPRPKNGCTRWFNQRSMVMQPCSSHRDLAIAA